jgi:hypothetical protein
MAAACQPTGASRPGLKAEGRLGCTGAELEPLLLREARTASK